MTTDSNNNELNADEYHSKKVSPPPTRSGVNYINVEDEDQMVSFFSVILLSYLIYPFYFVCRKFMATRQTSPKPCSPGHSFFWPPAFSDCSFTGSHTGCYFVHTTFAHLNTPRRFSLSWVIFANLFAVLLRIFFILITGPLSSKIHRNRHLPFQWSPFLSKCRPRECQLRQSGRPLDHRAKALRRLWARQLHYLLWE